MSGDKKHPSPVGIVLTLFGLGFERMKMPIKVNRVKTSAAKPDPFFGLNPILDPKFGLSRVGFALTVKKMGPIGSGWPQIGFKFGFNPIM